MSATGKVFVALLALAGLGCLGGELDVKGSFEQTLPVGWVQHDNYDGFKPLAKLKIVPGENPGENALLIHDNNAKDGTCVRTAKRFPVKGGDRVSISLKCRGSGTAWAGLYTYGAEGQWTGACPQEYFPLAAGWKTHQFEITVPDGGQCPTGSCDIVFGAIKGAEASFSDIKVLHEASPYSGTLNFPRSWTVFAPVGRAFKPTAEQLNTIPGSLGGATARVVPLVGDELDFAPLFGGQRAGNAAWAFAELDAPFACDYTLGAGADWWMEFHVNGAKALDTMANGNQMPCQLNNYVATVRLNKGRNVLAVKFVSGSASSLLTMGGPNELRGLNSKLKVSKVDAMDDYDQPGERPGKPELIQSYPTPGLLSLTGQGVHTAAPETALLFPGKTYALPAAVGERYFATGLRVQSFGRANRVDSSLNFDIAAADGPATFSLRLDHAAKSDTLTASVLETADGKTTVLKRMMFPYAMLPADVTLAVNQGNYVVNLVSLADSGLRFLAGDSSLLRRLGDKPVKTAAVFRSAGKAPAELVVDNYFTGEAGNQVKSAKIPFKVDRAETFDPVKAGWKLLFADEFDGDKVDWDKWYLNAYSNAYSKDFATLDGKGKLSIKTDFGPDGKSLMTSALWSRKTFGHGYFESRLRFTRQPGWWAAFWLYGPSNSNPALDGFEIDIFEDYYTRPRAAGATAEGVLDHNLHVYTGKLLKSWNYHSTLPGGLDDFYTLGVKWTPFEITYYLDGKRIKSSATHSPYDSVTFDAFNHAFGLTPLHAIVSGQIMGETADYDKKSSNGKFPEHFMVDYVRVYEYPADKAPAVSWSSVPESEIVAPGGKLVLEATARGDVAHAYLFDNGYLVDYKDALPYRFEFAIDKKHYANTPYMAPGRQGDKPELDGYPHCFAIAVQSRDGLVGHTPVKVIIPAKEGNKPYQGKAQAIPGTLKVGRYDEGGQDVAYHDTTPANNASKVFRPGEGVDCGEDSIGSVSSGEWLKYSVDIAAAGKYDVAARYGSPVYGGCRRVRVLLDGRPLGDLKLDKTTANWGTLDAVAALKGVELPAGRHTLTLLLVGAFNLADLEFAPVGKR